MADNETKIRITAETAQAESALGSLGGKVGGLADSITGQLAGALSIGAFAVFIKNSIDAADELGKMAERTGTSVEMLSGLKFAADQNATSLESVAKASQKLSAVMVGNPDLFKEMGITAKDSAGAMVELADVFAGMPDGVEKSALATKLFGDRIGSEMIPFLNQGTVALSGYIAEGQRLYPVTTQMAQESARLNDQLDKLLLQFKGIGIAIAAEVVPKFNAFIGGIKLIAVDFAQVMQKIGLAIEYATSPSRWGNGGTAEFKARLKVLSDLAEEEKIAIVRSMEGMDEARVAPSGAGSSLLGDLGGGGKTPKPPKPSKPPKAAKGAETGATPDFNGYENSLYGQGFALDAVASEQAAYEERLAAAQSYHEKAQTDEAAHAAMVEQIRADHEDALINLGIKGALSREKFGQLSAKSQLKVVTGTLSEIIGASAQHSKGMFNLMKVTRLAEAAVTLPSTITKAYESGVMAGGPFGPAVGAAYAALAFASQMIQINAMRSASFGGDAGGAAPSGGSVSSIAIPGQTANPNQIGSVAPPSASQPAPATINIYNTGNLLSADYVEANIIPQIKDAVQNRDVLLIDPRSRQAQVLGAV